MAEVSFKLFFSYSHKDESLRDELANHLAALKRQGVISSWHDRKILPGEEWDHQINNNLNTADIILLLISSNFLASDYCWDVEVQQAIERHNQDEACVIPVILLPVDWTGAPFAKLQALPKNAEPVISRHWFSQHEAFENVARGIRAAVEELKQKRQRKQEEAERRQQEAEDLQRQREHEKTERLKREQEAERRQQEAERLKREQEEAEKIRQNELASERGVDYSRLRDLLAAKKWKEADYETYLVMLQVVGRKQGDWIRSEEILNFPCTDLRTIDQLWVKYSDGHFGFSVQKEIYLSVGGKPDGQYYKEAWEKLGDRVGWRVKESWIDYTDVTMNTFLSPRGHLPGACWVGVRVLGFGWGLGVGVVGISSLASRLVNCNI